VREDQVGTNISNRKEKHTEITRFAVKDGSLIYTEIEHEGESANRSQMEVKHL
jgi:hypothetical protein